jgi:hypothetical protein
VIDFIRPLPEDEGFNSIMTMTDTLGSDICLVLTRTTLNATGATQLFLNHWFCKNSLPLSIVSDHDKLFVSKFWQTLCTLIGIRLQTSTAYHPENDGSSERSNKTVVQCLRYPVHRNQKGWVHALPLICFQMMNTINASTKFSGFELQMRCSPRLIPSLNLTCFDDKNPDLRAAALEVKAIIDSIKSDIEEAKDNLMAAKINQAFFANKSRNDDDIYKK